MCVGGKRGKYKESEKKGKKEKRGGEGAVLPLPDAYLKPVGKACNILRSNIICAVHV